VVTVCGRRGVSTPHSSGFGDELGCADVVVAEGVSNGWGRISRTCWRMAAPGWWRGLRCSLQALGLEASAIDLFTYARQALVG
jgi:hypothetical protein